MCEWYGDDEVLLCEAAQEWRAEVVQQIGSAAERQFPGEDGVVLQAILAPWGYLHQHPVSPGTVAQRQVHQGAAQWRKRQAAPKPTPTIEFPVVAQDLYDNEAASRIAYTETSIRAEIVSQARASLVVRFAHLEPEEIDKCLDTLTPLIARQVSHGSCQRFGAPDHQRALATEVAARATKMILDELGTIGDVKHKPGMTKGRAHPTMGRASIPVSRSSTDNVRWVNDPDTGQRHLLSPTEAEIYLQVADRLKPHKVGTERWEESDDRIADSRRPVRQQSTRKNKRSGRLGGSAVIR